MGVDGPTFKAKKVKMIEEKLLRYELARVELEKKAVQDTLVEHNMLMNMK